MAPVRETHTERSSSSQRGKHLRQRIYSHRVRRRGGDGLEILTPEGRLLKMIVSNLLPLGITEEANFRSFARARPMQHVPAKSKLCSLLPKVCQDKVKAIQAALASAQDIVLTWELWHSRPGYSYLTVGCNFVDRCGVLKSYMLKTSGLFSDTSTRNIERKLDVIIDNWNIKSKVHSVVTAGAKHPTTRKTRFIQMPCFAETLNSILEDLLGDSELKEVLRRCQDIVMFFKLDTKAKRMLCSGQNVLIMYSGGRWLGWLQMLQRLLEQYEVVKGVLQRRQTALILTEDQEKKVRQLVSALEVLEKATSMMKAKGFDSISVMLPVMTTLMAALQRETDKGNQTAGSLLRKCDKVFGDINKHQLATMTFLDPRYKDQLGEENKKLAKARIMKEFADSGGVCDLSGEFERYTAFTPRKGLQNPLSWWKNTGKSKFPNLSQLALRKLGIVSTAVPLERAFAISGEEFCNSRSSIEPENLDMMLFLNSNWT
ncbi:E3 SUMO-protein ligase ZBED1 [Menidia menidia]